MEYLPMLEGQGSTYATTARPLVRLETMEQLIRQFRNVAGKSGYLCKKDFKKAADIRSDFFADRLFQAIDADMNGCITCDEFVGFMYGLQCQDAQGRIRILFDLYDTEGIGGLRYAELVQILKASVQESNSQMEDEVVEHLAQCILSGFDLNNDGKICFEEFVAALGQYPHLLSALTVVGLGSDVSKSTGLGLITRATNAVKHGYSTIVNNPRRTVWILLLAATLVVAFWWRASRYISGNKCKLMGWTLPVAKGCGQMLKVILTLILLPVSRSTTTFLRETPLRHIVPFDDAISFHILLGTLGFVLAWIHSLCHVHDFLRWADPSRERLFHAAFPDEHVQPSHHDLWLSMLGITGIIQLVIYTLVFLTASSWPRRASWLVNTKIGQKLNNFKVIWYVHHLTAVFIGLVLVHGEPHVPNESREWAYSDVWAWIGIPVLVYLLERFGRALYKKKQVRILSAELLPGKVLALKMSKPKGFNCDSGMYAYINCPSVSLFEWHPFSLTSAPGADHLSVHIRVIGDWTEELYNRFRDYSLTLRHEVFAEAQATKVLPKLQTMSHSLGVGSCSRASEGIPPRPKGMPSHSRHATTGGLDDRLGIGRHHQNPSLPPLELASAGSGFSTPEPATLEAVHVETPPSRDLTPWDFKDVVHLDISRENSARTLTPRPEVVLTRMSPSAPLPDAPAPQAPNAHSCTPFAALAGQPICGMPRNTPSPVTIETKTSFLMDLAHVKDAPEEGPDDDGVRQLPLKLLLDGPFGAPAQGYRDYSVLLLVGAGIGVTPFASVLSELVHRLGTCGSAREQAGPRRRPSLRKVYFYWSVKSQSEVVWFSRVLEAIGKEDKLGLLDMNVHITGLRSANDVRTLPLKLAQVAVHHHTGMDVMSGINSRVLTRFGRPDWPRIFRDLKANHVRERIGVFYSGPNTLASVLRRLSHQHSTGGNHFKFVKESFGYW